MLVVNAIGSKIKLFLLLPRRLTHGWLLEIYFQNLHFGYYFLVLTSQRLLENNSRLEGTIAQNKIAQQAAGAAS